MASSAEDNREGLNALGNPDRQIRTGEDRGPEGEVRGIGATRPGGILARGTANKMRGELAVVGRGSEKLRKTSR